MTPRLRRRLAGSDADRRYNSTDIALDTGWRDGQYLAIDLETTGLDARRDEIIAYGAVPIVDGRIRLSQAVSGYVKPRGVVSAAATRVHALRTQDLDGAPPLVHGVDALLPAMTGRIIVAHCAWIERGFLARALRTCSAAVFHNPVIDTDALSRHWAPSMHHDLAPRQSIGLEYLADQLGLPVHAPHDALGDALTTAQVFLALTQHLAAQPDSLSAMALSCLGAAAN